MTNDKEFFSQAKMTFRMLYVKENQKSIAGKAETKNKGCKSYASKTAAAIKSVMIV